MPNETKLPSSKDREKSHERDARSVAIHIDFSELNERQIDDLPEALKRLPEEITFRKGINLIVGHNAQGKSSLLEGIWLSWLAMSRSLSVKELRERLPDVQDIQLHTSLTAARGISIVGLSDTLVDGQQPIKHFDYTASPAEDLRAQGGMAAVYGTTKYHTKSQRESRDIRLENALGEVSKERPSLLLLDEPEHGLDPWRHHRIKDMINELAADGSTFIVATNSPILVGDSGLPRVDLRFPEDGLTHQVR